MYSIEKLRAKRAARLADTRSAAEGNDFEILTPLFLPQGVNLWFPAEQCQMMMRVVQFEVTQKNNIDNNEIGDYVAARSYSLHRLPGQKKSRSSAHPPMATLSRVRALIHSARKSAETSRGRPTRSSHGRWFCSTLCARLPARTALPRR